MQIKEKAIVSLEPAADHSDKEGYFVELDGSGKAAIVNSAADIPLGVILDGETTAGRDSVGIGGGFAGTCHLKSAGTIAKGALVQLESDGRVVTDAGSGARVIVGRALEAAVANELFEAVLILPDARS